MGNTINYDSDSYASVMPHKSVYTDDFRIFHRGGFTYDYAEEIESLKETANGIEASLILTSGSKAFLKIENSAKNSLRIKFWEGEENFYEKSEMLADFEKCEDSISITENDTEYTLSACSVVIVLRKKPFNIEALNSNGDRIFELETEKIAGKYVAGSLGFRREERSKTNNTFISWRIKNGEEFFGLGEKWNRVEKTGSRATIWSSDTCGSNTTDLSYKSLPLIFSTKHWGAMLHSSFRSYWEVGNFSYTAVSALTEDSKIDAFFFFADSLKGLISTYTDVTGKPSMPPKWALGMWMSRCQYMKREEVEEVVKRIREEDIPCDVIHLDPLWMKTHYYFKIGVDACDFVWNEEGYPNHKEMLNNFKKDGFTTSFWINPYLPEGSKIYDEAKEKGYMLKDINGGIARLSHGEPVGMVDFLNPLAREWWKGYLKRVILEEGGGVLKPDYGDRVPETALSYDGKTGLEIHNIYLHYYAKVAYEAAEEIFGVGMVWRRAGYIGSQRMPGTWAGDTQVTWEGFRCCLRGGLSASFSGESFWASDIGGFVGPIPPSAELYIRWAQMGLLSSLSRFHGNSPREPWYFGEEAISVVRYYTKLRYRLIPYLLSQSMFSVKTGIPVMRHLKLEFEQEYGISSIDDEYMLGESLLVAPVFDEGSFEREVYLPFGKWYSYYNPNEVYEGGRYRRVKAPLEDIPLFVREGSIIPMYEEAPSHLKGETPSSLILNCYMGSRESTHSYKDGKYAVDIISRMTTRGGIEINIKPVELSITINVIGMEVKNVDSKSPIIWQTGQSVIKVNAKDGIRLVIS